MNEFFRTPRIAFFLGAIVLLGMAVPSAAPILAGHYPFTVRMGQHMLLQLVIPPLLLMSLPLKNSWRIWPPMDWTLKQPLITWLAGLVAMWGWHTPALCNAAVRSPFLHDAQALSLLVMGAAFWWPIAGPARAQRLHPLLGMFYLFTACMACTVLGIIITVAPANLYLAAPLPGLFNDWQFASPMDQRAGGLLMWVPGCLIYVCGILGLLARFYEPGPEAFPAVEPERTA